MDQNDSTFDPLLVKVFLFIFFHSSFLTFPYVCFILFLQVYNKGILQAISTKYADLLAGDSKELDVLLWAILVDRNKLAKAVFYKFIFLFISTLFSFYYPLT